MKKGFTLLELIITVAVLSVLLTMAAPSFSHVVERLAINQAKNEISQIYNMARSEATLRNIPMYVHFKNVSTAFSNNTDWCIAVTESATFSNCSNKVVYILKGDSLRDIYIKRHAAYSYVEFDRVRGWPDLGAGAINLVSFYKNENKPLNLEAHFVGRNRVCSDGGEWYGIGQC